MPRQPSRKNSKGQQRKSRANGEGTDWYDERLRKWRWQIPVRDNEGKLRRIGGSETTERDAKTAMRNKLTDQSRGQVPLPNSVTVIEYASQWIARQTHLTQTSKSLYEQELGYAMEHLGRFKVRDVQPYHVKDTLTRVAEREMKGGRGRGRKMSLRTLGKVRTRLRAVFREAVSDRIIYVSPLDGVRSPRSQLTESSSKVLDFHEAGFFHQLGWTLWELGLCRLWPAILTAMSVGLRRGEVLGLKWEDVDFDHALLKIRRQVTQSSAGKPVLKDTLKTRTSRRDIHMPASLIAGLHRHRERQDGERGAAGDAWVESGFVFTNELGGLVTPDRLNMVLSSIVNWSSQREVVTGGRGGVGAARLSRIHAVTSGRERLPDLTPHDLRHTYATLALRRGTAIEIVSRTLGHARISITWDCYRHVIESERRDQVVDLFETFIPLGGGAEPLAFN